MGEFAASSGSQRSSDPLAELEDALLEPRAVVVGVDDEAVAAGLDVLQEGLKYPFGRACDRVAATLVAAGLGLEPERDADAQNHAAVRPARAQLSGHLAELVGRKRYRVPDARPHRPPQRRP
jgi:hypothetical protein